MPYGYRRTYRAKKAYGRKTYRRKAYRGYSRFSSRTRIAKAVGKEARYASFNPVSVIPNIAGSSIRFCDMLQGDNNGQRTGNKILVKSLHIAVEAFCLPTANTNNTTQFRAMIILWRQPNGLSVIPSNESLLLNGATAANNYKAFLNPDGFAYYKVLRDWNVSLNPIANTRATSGTAGAYDSGQRAFRRFRINFKKGLTVWYNANTGNPSDVIKNQLILLCYGADGNANFNASARMLYYP